MYFQLLKNKYTRNIAAGSDERRGEASGFFDDKTRVSIDTIMALTSGGHNNNNLEIQHTVQVVVVS